MESTLLIIKGQLSQKIEVGLGFKNKYYLTKCIHLFHNGGQIKYSFVLMLISPTSLATTSKFQKNICFKTRAVGLINIKTKECKSGPDL